MVAIVRKAALPKYSPSYLAKVYCTWKTGKTSTFWEYIIEKKRGGVAVYMRGRPAMWEFFPITTIEEIPKVIGEVKCLSYSMF